MMDMERVAIRVDSSVQMGSGHLMRCLTLAERMSRDGKEIHFICRDLMGHLCYLIENKGFFLHMLPAHSSNPSLTGHAAWLTVTKDTDAQETIETLCTILPISRLVVDSYALDIAWERKIRPFVQEIFVIDDLANRKHDCDILLDFNFYRNMRHRYDGLVPQHCKLLLGLRYILLREEFYTAQKQIRQRDGVLRRIFVFYGGSDATRETEKAIHALLRCRLTAVEVDVVVGGSNAHHVQIERLCKKYDYLHYHYQVSNMAQIMMCADLCLGAGGTNVWERCFLGIPAIVTAVAENQIEICEDCAEAGYIYYIGRWDEVSEGDIVAAIRKCIVPQTLREMQRRCQFIGGS